MDTKVDMAQRTIACIASIPLKANTVVPSSESSQPRIYPQAMPHPSKMRPPDPSNSSRHVCCLHWSKLDYHN